MAKPAVWTPLKSKDWDRKKARHLALRLGYSAHPAFVEELEKLGPAETVEKYLAQPTPMPEPGEIMGMEASYQNLRALEPEERRAARQQLQKKERESYADFAVDWYAFARQPEHSIQEKMVQFFANVWVAAFQGVRNVSSLFKYHATIRGSIAERYPAMCLKLSQTTAIARYLDLNQNKAASPNENFARELFELFTLGEGNYSEQDIKEAARALTGYIVNRNGEMQFRPRIHDSGQKTLFGKKGNFAMEDVIRLTFQQPAAARFLPLELCQAYLSDTPLAENELDELASIWSEAKFDLVTLYRTVFASERFYREEARGALIKAPEQFYIGLLQDLELDVPPLARNTFRIMRQMGQPFLNPPNVRGWVGGRNWINSATLAARKQAVQLTLRPINEDKLNADEQRAIAAAREQGVNRFAIDLEAIRKRFATGADLVQYVRENVYPESAFPSTIDQTSLMEKETIKMRDNELRSLLSLCFNLPVYHLC